MEVIKVAKISEDEAQVLIQAGKILKDLNEAFEKKEVNTLYNDSRDLLTALHDILDKLYLK